MTFIYLTQTEEQTKFSNEKSITCLIIASSYIAARSMCAGNYITATGSCLNPAIGIGTSIVMLFNDGSVGLKWIWLYGLLPFAGAILAVFFHEFIFK